MINLAAALEIAYDEVHYMDFYRDIFPVGSFEQKGVYEDGKYNGIAVSIAAGSKKTKRFTVTDDLEVIEDMAASDDFCLMSPISYAGKSRKSENARFLYALTIDLDGVKTRDNWDTLIFQVEKGDTWFPFGLPRPSYLISSGTGIHIYYVFEKPIPCFKNIVKQLEVLKRRLTWQAWTQGASELYDNVQYESLFQGFRMVGSITKTGGRCKAFKVGNKVTVEYLNKFVPEEYRVQSFAYKSELTLQKAKEKFPEWYERRIEKKQPKGTWVCKKDLYNWWLSRWKEAQQGHRYWYVMTLATYAKKCNVPYDELEKDALGLVERLNAKGDRFTEDDVIHALEAYNDSYITYPIDTIVNRTGIKIEKNKRNGRKQDVHLERARAVQAIDYPNGEWREGNGRPKGSGTAALRVYRWRQKNPAGTKKSCKEETGLTYPTIRKWWNYSPPLPYRQENGHIIARVPINLED